MNLDSAISAYESRGAHFKLETIEGTVDHNTSLVLFSPQMSRLTDNFDLTELLKPQDTEGARRKWAEYLNLHYPSNVICLQVVVEANFDNSDDFDVDGGEWPPKRHTAAHQLHDQLQEVMSTCEDGGERERINANYSLAEAIVTPIHRLPDDLLSEIFVFVIERFYQELSSLRAVCRKWDTILTLLPIFSSNLELHKWTDKDDVEAFLKRGNAVPLTVTIFTGDDTPPLANESQPYEALELALKSVDRWHYLTFQRLGKEIAPLAASLQNHLSKISKNAKSLKSLFFNDENCLFILSQPSHTDIFSGLTLLFVSNSGHHEPVDILPHLLVLEELQLHKVVLADHDANTSLPLANSLWYLELHSVSIQWMGGHEFKNLQICRIYLPLQHNDILPAAVALPVCFRFVYFAQPFASLSGFVVPRLEVLEVGNKVSNKTQNAMESLHIQGFLSQGSLQSLDLTMECRDQDLLRILALLPSLEKLILRPQQPQSVGWNFFSALIARPCQDGEHCDHWWCTIPGTTSDTTICPLLRSLVVSYYRWLRDTETDIVLPILLAVAESRRAAGEPFSLEVISLRAAPSFNILDIENTNTQAICEAFHRATKHHSIQLIGVRPQTILYLAHKPLSVFLHQITELTISLADLQSFHNLLDILRHCKTLRLLSLAGLPLQCYPLDKKLPLVRTLHRATLSETSLDWMGGRTFTLLKECRIIKPNLQDCAELLPVQLPVCTLLEFWECPPALLPKLHSPRLKSLILGPIPFHLPWQPDLESHLVHSWILQFEFPSQWGPLTDELDLLSQLSMIGTTLVWPGGMTSQKLQAHVLVGQQLVYAEVDQITGVAGSWFQFEGESEAGGIHSSQK